MALNRKTFKKAAGDAPSGNLPSGYFNTVLYTGNGGTQSVGGFINRAAVFNGTSSQINLGNSQAFSVTQAGEISISLWLKTTDDQGYIYAKADDSAAKYEHNLELFANGTLKSAIYNSSAGLAASVTSTATVNDGNWHHIVVTIDNGSSMSLYIDNGTPVTTTSWSGSVAYQSTTPFLLGAFEGIPASTSKLNGSIDQLRIFNKELSSTEVTTLYGETSASASKEVTDIFSDSSAIALYQLDGNANDTGGGLQQGKFGGAAVFNGTSKIDITGFSNFGSTGVSISAWVNISSFSNGPTIVNLYSNNSIVFGTTSAGNFFRSGQGTTVLSNTAMSTNTWHNVVLTADTSGNVSLYLDGSAAGGGNSTTSMYSSNNNADLIGAYGTLSQPMNGKIDEVRIYSDVLTSTEVGHIYNNTTASIPTGNLEAHYKLDGNAIDETGSHNGTSTNVSYNYNGTATNVTYHDATNFSPDLVWIKSRDVARNHYLYDSIRGVNKQLRSDSSEAEHTPSFNRMSSFNSNGFTVNAEAPYPDETNKSGEDYVSWCFNAGTNAPATNNDGTISSTVKANQDAGFSIVKTSFASGESNSTVGHGLNEAPTLIIVKRTDAADDWYVKYNFVDGSPDQLRLNTTAASEAANFTPTSTTVIGFGATGAAHTTIAYCFHSVDGIQKVGSYTGTGVAGNSVVTGFEPRFIMWKATNSVENWYMMDSARGVNNVLYADGSFSEGTSLGVSFNSNGFTLTGSFNGSGTNYIYLAIAADPDITTPTVENSFDVVTYTGNGGTQSIDVGFKPDLVWVKDRDGTDNHHLFDSIRGANQRIMSNHTAAENTEIDCLNSFDSNGFSIGANSGVNASGDDHVAWCWKAGDHDDNLPQINTEGTIDSIVSVNDEAGFSIVKWTGNGGSGQSVGHGLSSAPEMVIFKRTDASQNWFVFVKVGGVYKRFEGLNTTAASTSVSYFGTSSTSITWSGTTADFNGSGREYIMYCFTSISGYQEVGSYTGTGASGNSITTGFQPRFVMIKNTASGYSWIITDSTRQTGKILYPNLSNAEFTLSTGITSFDSNGFTLGTDVSHNNSGDTFIYLAIA